MEKIKNNYDALVQALVLAVEAPTDKDTLRCQNMAEELHKRLVNEYATEIMEKAQKDAEARLEAEKKQ